MIKNIKNLVEVNNFLESYWKVHFRSKHYTPRAIDFKVTEKGLYFVTYDGVNNEYTLNLINNNLELTSEPLNKSEDLMEVIGLMMSMAA